MAIAKPYTGIDIQFGTITPPVLAPKDPGSLYYVTLDGTPSGSILEQWTFFKTGGWTKTDAAPAPETVTSLSLSANTLSYVDEAGATTDLDLSLYLDDTNLARLVSGTLDSTSGIATFTRDDNTTFTIDLSALNIKRIQDLTDVQLTSIVTGQVLSWNGTSWVNQTLPTGVTTLTELTDVDVATKASGDVLTWNGTDWAAVAPAAIPSNLDSLTDVVITSATTDQLLKFNGTNWVNSTVTVPTNLDSLTDVVITTPSSGQALTFNGTNWVNTTLVGGGAGGATELDQLLDTDVAGVVNGDTLVWNNTTSKWEPAYVPKYILRSDIIPEGAALAIEQGTKTPLTNLYPQTLAISDDGTKAIAAKLVAGESDYWVMASNDGGGTWVQTGLKFGTFYPNVVWYINGKFVFRNGAQIKAISEDFSTISTASGVTVDVYPAAPFVENGVKVLYAKTFDDSKCYKTTNGTTFTELTPVPKFGYDFGQTLVSYGAGKWVSIKGTTEVRVWSDLASAHTSYTIPVISSCLSIAYSEQHGRWYIISTNTSISKRIVVRSGINDPSTWQVVHTAALASSNIGASFQVLPNGTFVFHELNAAGNLEIKGVLEDGTIEPIGVSSGTVYTNQYRAATPISPSSKLLIMGSNSITSFSITGGGQSTFLPSYTIDHLDNVDAAIKDDTSILMWSDADAKWIPARVPWVEPVVVPPPPSTDIFTNITPIVSPMGVAQQQSIQQSGSTYSHKAYVVRAGTGFNEYWFTKDFVTFTQPWVAYGGIVTDTCTTVTYVNGTYILYNTGNSVTSTTPYFVSSDGLNWIEMSVTGITGTFAYNYMQTFGTDVWGCNFGGNFYWTTDGVIWNKEAYSGSTAGFYAYVSPTFVTENGSYAISKADSSVIDIFDMTVYPPAFLRTRNVNGFVNVACVGNNFYYGQASGSSNTDVYKSTDYGVTWTKIGTAARSNVYKVSVIKNRIYFYGNGIGVVVVNTDTDEVGLYHPSSSVEWVGRNGSGDIIINESITNTDATYWDLATADIYGEITYKEFVVDDLVNVNITDKQNGEVLTWDSNTQKWVNRSIQDPLGVDTITEVISSAGAIAFSGNIVNTGIITPTGALTSLEWTGITATSQTVISSKVTTIIKQGATAYLPTSYKVDGTTVSVKWAGGVAPTAGTANGINIITLNIIRIGGVYTVTGQMVSYS